jgi:hypothetical protein
MRSYDSWLQDSAAYEGYSALPAEEPTEDEIAETERRGVRSLKRRVERICARQIREAADARDTDGLEPALQAQEMQYEEDTMQTVSRQEARAHRIETALREIEEAADIGRFRPEVAGKCLGEIWHKTKQLRADLGVER